MSYSFCAHWCLLPAWGLCLRIFRYFWPQTLEIRWICSSNQTNRPITKLFSFQVVTYLQKPIKVQCIMCNRSSVIYFLMFGIIIVSHQQHNSQQYLLFIDGGSGKPSSYLSGARIHLLRPLWSQSSKHSGVPLTASRQRYLSPASIIGNQEQMQWAEGVVN